MNTVAPTCGCACAITGGGAGGGVEAGPTPALIHCCLILGLSHLCLHSSVRPKEDIAQHCQAAMPPAHTTWGKVLVFTTTQSWLGASLSVGVCRAGREAAGAPHCRLCPQSPTAPGRQMCSCLCSGTFLIPCMYLLCNPGRGLGDEQMWLLQQGQACRHSTAARDNTYYYCCHFRSSDWLGCLPLLDHTAMSTVHVMAIKQTVGRGWTFCNSVVRQR